MKRFLAGLLLGSALFTGLAGVGYAQESPSTTGPRMYPYVGDRRPFSYEANYMSLPGFLRFIVYQREGVWMARWQAASVVDQQLATGE